MKIEEEKKIHVPRPEGRITWLRGKVPPRTLYLRKGNYIAYNRFPSYEGIELQAQLTEAHTPLNPPTSQKTDCGGKPKYIFIGFFK